LLCYHSRMKVWERIKQIADDLRDYGQQHSYTEWESDRIDSMCSQLIALAMDSDAQMKQMARSAGGLNVKVKAMGAAVKALEARLEELEAENAALRRDNQ
jgi:hypothetical protein